MLAKVRSSLLHCANCRAGLHGSHMVCFHPSVLEAVEQDIMIGLLDDCLLDYTTSFPFLTVYAAAKYLLLEDSFFRHQLATYALLRQEETYFNKYFLPVIHDLFIKGKEDFAPPRPKWSRPRIGLTLPFSMALDFLGGSRN